jgi:hypothetical protein
MVAATVVVTYMEPRMARKVTSVRVGISRISRPVWDKMLAAYRERPQIKHVMEVAQVGKKMARRAILEGWPDHSLPPFVQLEAGASSIHKEMAKVRESWETADITRGEAARQAAEEAMAARTVMAMALRTMKINQHVLEKIMEKLEAGEVPIPDEMTPKILYQLTKSMDTAAAVVQKAMDVERKRLGEPEQVLGIQIGLLLDHCEDGELELVMRTGEVPRRLLDQRAGASAAPHEGFTADGGQIIDIEEEVLHATDIAPPTEDGFHGTGSPTGNDAPAADDAELSPDEEEALGEDPAAAVGG